jgi:hypothetical protein
VKVIISVCRDKAGNKLSLNVDKILSVCTVSHKIK